MMFLVMIWMGHVAVSLQSFSSIFIAPAVTLRGKKLMHLWHTEPNIQGMCALAHTHLLAASRAFWPLHVPQ